LLFSGLAFFILLKYLKRTLTITLDFDWFWRKFSQLIINEFNLHLIKNISISFNKCTKLINKSIETLHKHNGPSGILGRSWPTGNMALWTTILLGSFLLFYLFW
jgi:multicomponent Na+:H+ antiporter subunit D